MSYWHFLIISAAVIVSAVLFYLVQVWRKAQRAFRAMCVVAIASLAAGVLIGVWSIHTLDVWVRIAGRNAASSPDVVRRAPEGSSWPHTPVGESSPSVSSAASAAAADRTNVIIGSYVGQALAQGHMEGEITEKTEEWPQVEQGCRLGNYQRTSARCRAAELAVDGWGDTKPIPLNDLAKFCDANYLEQSLALCLVTHGGDDRSASSTVLKRVLNPATYGIPEADVLQELRRYGGYAGRGPNGQTESWSEVAPLCARGVYAPASPKCEASAILTDGRPVDARVPYSEVAAFCDVNLLTRESEICRAAYRLIQSTDDSAR
jgi:hypothetical protein